MSGEGYYIVINVGKNSAMGKIHDLIVTEDSSKIFEFKIQLLHKENTRLASPPQVDVQ